MAEYPLAQAAARAGMDERSFRLLSDRRVVFATPRTRTLGRGKQKLYSTDEILIASILGPIIKLGASSFDLAAIADWLRKNSAGHEFSAAREHAAPVFIRLRFEGDENWGITMDTAMDPWSYTRKEGEKGNHRLYLPATEPSGGDGLAQEFFAIKLSDRIWRVEVDWIQFHRSQNTPSQILSAQENKPKFLEDMRRVHTDAEIDHFLQAAQEGAANGDKWP